VGVVAESGVAEFVDDRFDCVPGQRKGDDSGVVVYTAPPAGLRCQIVVDVGGFERVDDEVLFTHGNADLDDSHTRTSVPHIISFLTVHPATREFFSDDSKFQRLLGCVIGRVIDSNTWSVRHIRSSQKDGPCRI
jgi:hypothetical protein